VSKHYPTLNRLLVCIAALLLSACASQQPEPITDANDLLVVEAGEPIRIGLAVARSGPGLEEIGEAQLRGVALAVQQHGAITGFPLEIVSIDSGCSAPEGLTAATALVEGQNVAAVIGHTCNSSCMGAVSTYEEAGMTLISPSCGGAELTESLAHSESFLRTVYEDSTEGALAAEFAFYELGARQAALVNDLTPESETLLDGFDARFTGLGGETAAIRFTADSAESMAEMWQRIQDMHADVVYAPLLPEDAASFIRGRAQALPEVLTIGSRTYQNRWLLDEVGERADGIYFGSPFSTEPSLSALNEAYTRQYGEPPNTVFHAYAYDAAMLVLQAIDSVGHKSGQQFEIDREALRAAIYATSTYSGTTGTITCTNVGDCSAGKPAIYQIVDGDWTVIYAP
jgi:branched-chain amino acid transport system substrate-binding protein